MNLFTRGTGAFARLALVLLLVAVVAAPAVASVGDYRCVDATRVYLGNARLFHTPCHVDSDAIYRQIPEYREILEKGLTDRDVQYHFLMKKAAQKFAEAVKSMARDNGNDLVAEMGTVSKARDEAPEVPDRTQAVISALSS
ncbi:MAG: hypothetical protein H6806_05885 [Planctomycetes bacterium]|nr:hypothetical protein [Planctomycetota bacterium]MCB9824837.1 hypothetical protein [Planctomycetota bacterium]MCB9829271.1 hypothetical protein [Planctomycetota bacterium]MCB9901757.1 hypothetical protein [Planctomycetota bacterium]